MILVDFLLSQIWIRNSLNWKRVSTESAVSAWSSLRSKHLVSIKKNSVSEQSMQTMQRIILWMVLLKSFCISMYTWPVAFLRYYPYAVNSCIEKKQGRKHGVKCVLARTDSNFGQKWHFRMVSTHVWPTDGRTDRWTDRRTDGRTDGRTHLLIEMRERI